MQGNGVFTAFYDHDKSRKSYFPVRLVRREKILYVVCTTSNKGGQFESYAVHRLKEVSPTDQTHRKWSSAYIDKRLAPGVDESKRTYQLRIRLSGPATTHFTEVRFHEDEKKGGLTWLDPDREYENIGNETKLKAVTLCIAEIAYTYEIKTWILGLGSNAVVLEPAEIRRDIENEVRAMAFKYQVTG